MLKFLEIRINLLWFGFIEYVIGILKWKFYKLIRGYGKMERYGDISELLAVVDSNLLVLSSAYEGARKNEEQNDVVRPLIKSMLSDLRSVLDYSAQSIWESYTTKSSRLHFPYGVDEVRFRKSIKDNLNGLEQQRPNAFKEVESIQPHACGDNWLFVLCSMTNTTKHNNLGKQVRENSKAARTRFGMIADIGGGGRLILEDCIIDGVLVGGNGKPFEISNERTVKQMQAEIKIPIEIIREYEWVKFKFDDHLVDALELLTRSRDEIRLYVERLRLVI